jgi:isoquinoline 1-oxidoreductase beta subunit
MRRDLLAGNARHLAVLNTLAEKSDWKNIVNNSTQAVGLALHESFNTVVGLVAYVKKVDTKIKLERVVCVVDCGLAINPNIVEMQMESGIGYGLAAILHGAITLKDGHIEQSNFDNYPVLRMNQMPAVEVHIMPSTNKPSGVGEPSTPVIGPALLNAIARLTGKSIRTLPLSSQGIEMV